ncbi:MAG TPA: class I SAM-dependent methyltransferase, partial [Myxococcales bacterium]|nr:class I SAM-dependent methyltransferase [Myxococcales bacterium]
EGTDAFRVYDRDMPEHPVVVEWYAGRVQVQLFPRREADAAAMREEVGAAVAQVLGVPAERVHYKVHRPHKWGESQYGREGHGGERFTVTEGGLRFRVNLGDYLDTGLFLDHRGTRARVRAEARGKRFLNLFCYTGAFTVHAAAGGAARTTSVDLSATYLEWAEENLRLNALSGPRHQLVRADAVEWLAQRRPDRYDLVVLDPPSFSASKRMERRLDVQRDHPRLLAGALALLAPGGVLYFSTNFRGFQLDERALAGTSFQELTPGSLPADFHQRDIHRCWRVGPL